VWLVSIYAVFLLLDRSLILNDSSWWDRPAVELWYLWFIYKTAEGWRGELGSPRSCASLEVDRLLWILPLLRGYGLPRCNESNWCVPLCFVITEEEPSSETLRLNEMWRQKMSNICVTVWQLKLTNKPSRVQSYWACFGLYKVQNKPNSSVQHTPSSESFQV
jgi:hypothetical protein